MILCIGEILADMIGEEKEGVFSYQRRAGGAPFNVACACGKFGVRSAFFGSVGKDAIGDFLVDFVGKQPVEEYYIRRDGKRNTTLAFVQLDSFGERSFSFYRKNTADYHLDPIPDELMERCSIVHIGSLMLSEKIGRKYANEVIAQAHRLKKLVSFDVNFREDIFSDRKEAVRVYREIISQADIVKFSEDEVSIFTEDYVDNLKGALVCISLGKNGSRYIYKENRQSLPSISVRPVDTTGAGDAFYGGILSQLDGVRRENWNRRFLDRTFRFANICGALNTLGKGAIDPLPDLTTIRRYLKEREEE